MNIKKDAKRLLNGEIVISDTVKNAERIKETYSCIGKVDYIRELPINFPAKL